MKRDHLPSVVIGVVVTATVILGLWLSGGPPIGRAERNDAKRVRDMIAMSEMIRCSAGLNGSQLPKTYTIDPQCDDGAAYNDPVSGEPYSYVWISVQGYRICGEFETDSYAQARIYSGVVWRNGRETCIALVYRP